jgi:DNA-binding GntR family transcriptional regulator
VQQVRELRRLAADIYREYQQGSRIKAARLDQAFHARLVEIADNATLNRLATLCAGLGKVVTFKGGDWELAYNGHLRILEAIESGDEDAAERVIRKEVRLAREQLVEFLKDPVARVTWLGPLARDPASSPAQPVGPEKPRSRAHRPR